MTQPTAAIFPRTIGLDLGLRSSAYCTVQPSGERVHEGTLATSQADMRTFFSSEPKSGGVTVGL